MTRWREASAATRSATAIGVTAVLANVVVFAVAAAVVGPARCTGPNGSGVSFVWILVAIGAAAIAIATAARFHGASRLQTSVFGLIELSLGVGVAFIALVLPLQAHAGCTSFF